MAMYQLARFEVHADSLERVQRAMHDFAAYVRKELPGSMWTAYSDPAAPTRFSCFLRTENPAAERAHRAASGVTAFTDALAPYLVGTIEASEMQLVTSSDLAPRHRKPRSR
jgi:quinol monooxygenase YgiN